MWLRKLNYYTGKEDLKALSLETFDSICIVADGEISFDDEQGSLSKLIISESIYTTPKPHS